MMLNKILVAPALLLIFCYRTLVSPLLGGHCRYDPTCSAYALEALKSHGWRGYPLVMRRLLRCHPWGGSGVDDVPPAPQPRRDI